MLRSLRMPAIAAQFEDLALKAAKGNLTHEAFLYELVRAECIQREEHRITRLLRLSGLPPDKTFRTLQLDRFPPLIREQLERLRSGVFLDDAVNLVAAGKPGVGKSHALAAVGHELVQLGHQVLWTPTATLVQELLAAKRDLRLPQLLAKLDRYVCVFLDDIGYVQHDRDEMEVLFTFLAERYERRSVAISILWNQKSTSFPQQIRHELVDSSVDVDRSALSSWFKVARESLAQSRTSGRSADREPTSPLIPVCG